MNVVVNHRRNILAAFAGDPIRAHRAGADAARKIFMIGKQDKHDLVIASTGGHPKDWQLYQAVKSLQNASEICAEGGTILLLARCQEMFGNGILQHWIETIQDRERIVRMLEQQFVLGPHKVKYMDDVLQKHQVILYSDIPKPLAALAGFETADDLQETVNHQLSIRPHAKIAVMPYAGLTFPY